SGTFPGAGAFGVALNIYHALTTGYQSGYVYWQMGDGGNNSSFSLTGNAERTNAPKYNAFKHYSKFIRPNAIRLNTSLTGSGNIQSTAFIHDENKTLTYVLINSENATRNVTVNIPTGLDFILTTLAGYRTSNNNNFINTNYIIASNSVTVSMPAYSIVTLYGKGLGVNPKPLISISDVAQSTNLSVSGLINWTITKSASTWLTLSTASGFGSNVVSLTASGNIGAIRNAILTVAGGGLRYVVTVTQAAPGGSSLVANPLTLNYPVGGSSQNIGITSNVSWTSVSSQTWLTLTNGSGSNNGTISATASSNAGVLRTAEVTISGGSLTQIVNITQTGIAAPTLSVSTSNLFYSAKPALINVSVSGTATWTTASSQPWLTFTGGSGTGNGVVSLSAVQNPTTSNRTANVSITGPGITRIISVTQEG
ncbi:MAG: hypothetical protein EAZ16_14975, partial [Sphingobacteriales bacterium]